MAKKAAKRTGKKVTTKVKVAKDRFHPMKKKQRSEGHEDEGPLSWFVDQMESLYAPLVSKAAGEEGSVPVGHTEADDAEEAVASLARATFAIPSLRDPQQVWTDLLAEYKQRRVASVPEELRAAAALGGPMITPAGPTVPGGRNWVPLGPTVVLGGQTVGNEPVGGRIAGLAISNDGTTVFAASACGGVFRSDDAGTSWRSLMDNFDTDPTNFAAVSLACGAIAIDQADPRRIYVGTGEGDTHQMFAQRIVNALPAYRGIGPIRSDDGGLHWIIEKTAAGSPDLAGKAFFALAVDPRDRENVVAATTEGLYQRTVSATGEAVWHRRLPGLFSSVVVARSAVATRFYAAEWGKGVIFSTDGQTWTTAGVSFPTSGVERIALGVQPTNADLVYAFVVNTKGLVLGIYRLDKITGSWTQITNPPDVLPKDENGFGQGNYDIAISIDPANADLVYLGGSYYDASPYPGSVWRCPVKTTATGYKFHQSASIGTHAHADVHVLKHTPGNANELWCGCDGGVFLNRDPKATGEFAGLNHGLSCLCSNFIAQHPTDPAILFTGLQDNATARTSGGPQFERVLYGDGGYCLVNWANPDQVLAFMNGKVYRSTTGGANLTDWSLVWNFGWATMTQPIVSTAYTPATPANADWVAVGAGAFVFISSDFASTWQPRLDLPDVDSPGNVFALAFASPKRLYVGTTEGRVYRADRTGSATWSLVRLDNVAAGPLPIKGLVSDIAIDWSDASQASIYLCFGGMGDQRHVWYFDGTKWASRSGTSPSTSLLDVEHNALVVDPKSPKNLYVGADIGVWHSSDQGLNWKLEQNGLPDAAVFDLQIHATQRLLRASTHGRGIYELALLP